MIVYVIQANNVKANFRLPLQSPCAQTDFASSLHFLVHSQNRMVESKQQVCMHQQMQGVPGSLVGSRCLFVCLKAGCSSKGEVRYRAAGKGCFCRCQPP